jgi:hypothetical protein
MPIDQIVELHDDIKAGLDPATEVRCPSCGSLAFRYPGYWTTTNPCCAPDVEHLSRAMVN